MGRSRFAGAVLGAAALFGTVAFACGDKLLVIGRGVRSQRVYASHVGNLVIYSTDTQSGGALRSAKLQTALKRAGHKLRMVEKNSQLNELLKSERVDVVLADIGELAGITRELQSAPSRPVVLPILFKPSRAEFSAAQREYQFALKVPADDIQYLIAIDEAMKSRLRTGAKI